MYCNRLATNPGWLVQSLLQHAPNQMQSRYGGKKKKSDWDIGCLVCCPITPAKPVSCQHLVLINKAEYPFHSRQLLAIPLVPPRHHFPLTVCHRYTLWRDHSPVDINDPFLIKTWHVTLHDDEAVDEQIWVLNLREQAVAKPIKLEASEWASQNPPAKKLLDRCNRIWQRSTV